VGKEYGPIFNHRETTHLQFSSISHRSLLLPKGGTPMDPSIGRRGSSGNK